MIVDNLSIVPVEIKNLKVLIVYGEIGMVFDNSNPEEEDAIYEKIKIVLKEENS